MPRRLPRAGAACVDADVDTDADVDVDGDAEADVDVDVGDEAADVVVHEGGDEVDARDEERAVAASAAVGSLCCCSGNVASPSVPWTP
jgi:hypothetical protein